MSSPRIERLPPEMLTNITDRLELQDKVRLSMVDRFFRGFIGQPTHAQFLQAESSEWAIARNLYTCSNCVNFRHLLQFANDMRKGKRARQGLDADKRKCLRCGVVKGWYSEGTEVAVLEQRAVLVPLCRTLTDQTKNKAVCGSSGVWLEWVPKETLSNRQRFEDDWAHATRNFTEGKHTEELCGFWLDH